MIPIPFQSRNRRSLGLNRRINARALHKQVAPAATGRRRGQPSHQLKWVGRLALLLVLIYFIRGTVLPRFLPIPAVYWFLITGLALSVVVGVNILGGGTCRWSWVMVLLAFAAGIFQAEQFTTAALHWVGVAVLILAVGPVILNPVALEMRSAAWRFSINGIIALTAIFIVWYALRLPSYGAGVSIGGFTSFMNQCMLLGPITGIGVVIALARALHRSSWRWGLFAIIGLIPTLASSSRVAVLATGAAGCFLLVRRKPVLGGLMALIFLLVVYGFVTTGGSDESDGSFTSALAQKGTNNTRANLWQSRIEEFESSPAVGIGIGMGTTGASTYGNDSIRIEPGSSYLAILSMTGGLGAIAFLSALGLLLFSFVFARRKPALDKDILSVIGVYLAVQGVAEGWILGFGNPLCFLFWLWLGNVGDFVLQPARAMAKRRLPAPPRFARPIGPAPTISTFKLRPDH